MEPISVSLSSQLDTILQCRRGYVMWVETSMVCDVPAYASALHLSMEGWPGWVDLRTGYMSECITHLETC